MSMKITRRTRLWISSPSRSLRYAPACGGAFAWSLACLVGASLALVSSSHAALSIVDSAGFENPPFIPGTLEGQNGWVNAALGSNASVATVQGGVVLDGSQALQVSRAANSDERWALPVDGYPTDRFVSIRWDMRVNQSAGAGFGPFFGVEAYDDNGLFGLIGSLGVDATTGDVLFQEEDTGVLVETGVAAGFNTWNNYELRLDFANYTYEGYVNGALVASTGFVDRGISGTNLDELTDADISTFAASFDSASQSKTGVAFFDNFAVFDVQPGDVNFDLQVDDADFGIWEEAFAETTAADIDGDGDTDGFDFLILQQNYGGGIGASLAAGGFAAAPIPEPSTWVLATLAAMAVRRRRNLG